MPTLAIKTIGGKQAGEVTASERVFAARVNIPLMHQAVKAAAVSPGAGKTIGISRDINQTRSEGLPLFSPQPKCR